MAQQFILLSRRRSLMVGLVEEGKVTFAKGTVKEAVSPCFSGLKKS